MSEGLSTTINFNEVSEHYQAALQSQVTALKEMEAAKVTVESASVKIEYAEIAKAGGEPKKVGSTEADRQRAYSLAKINSSSYESALLMYHSAKADYRYYQGMVRLCELYLQFLIATAKAE